MKLVVKSRDLKWAGSRLFRGSEFEVASERERPLADLLLKLGKVELVKDRAPYRQVATTRVLKPEPEAVRAPIREPDSQPKAATEADAPTDPPRYRTRRLKSED